jgi:hypothetical protein
LGLPGTPAADILSSLGKPDEFTPSLDNTPASVLTMPGKKVICIYLFFFSNSFFKGPAIPSGGASAEGGQQAYYFRYYVQPKKDYLYFKVRYFVAIM